MDRANLRRRCVELVDTLDREVGPGRGDLALDVSEDPALEVLIEGLSHDRDPRH